MRCISLSLGIGLVLLLALGACTTPPTTPPSPTAATIAVAHTPIPASATTESNLEPRADVTAVAVSGSEGAYQIAVTIASPDTGCDQFADWWEVVTADGESEDGELLYRRVLLHSHVGEQPFTRSGGPVDMSADTVVIIRAHMNVGGYGGAGFKGSVAEGFRPVELDAGFAADVETLPPLPEGCAF